MDNIHIHIQRGEHATHYLLERGIPCTALAAATDTCALAVMRTFQAAGYHVPNDLAVVGFDDTVEAQYASPPLTTVRCKFDALGRAAVEQLLTQIRDGQAQESRIVSVPTILLHRRSCGCNTLDQRLTHYAAALNDPTNWQTALAQQLAQTVRYPLTPDPMVAPTQLWPGASNLVAAIDTTLHGQPAAPSDQIANAWQQAVAQTESMEVLHTVLTLLEDAADQQLSATSQATRRPAVVALLRQIRLEMIRALLAQEVAPRQQLNVQLRSNYEISMALLSGTASEAQALGWLDETSVTWGCLGLWEGQGATPQR